MSRGNILEKKLRVAAYARVSTDSDEQSTSFYSQQKYYMDKILSNPNWSFVEVYADEGISGTQAFKRDNFLRMNIACPQELLLEGLNALKIGIEKFKLENNIE